ncbi:hypothetical protein Golomagni_06988 [Golovinomyces magnicellulatus]|nr:hypothetical protein Golomagni_06988 [Golovinomyces magnicellulatus]
MTNQEIPGKLVALAIEKFGRLDGMVINHGMLENAPLSATTMESFRYQFDVNVFSCLALAQAGLQEIKKANGAIIWISSGASVKTYKAWGTYGATKAALNAISSHMAVEEPDITSVAIQPGRVNTGMQALIRDTGKGVMDDKAYATFIEAYNTDDLLKPAQPGSVIARVVANPSKELSGKFMA